MTKNAGPGTRPARNRQSAPTIVADGLVKRYGDKGSEVRALDGFDLEVPAGTVCALLGPNGAGKTTAVRILTTLLRPDEGRAEVAGLDVVAEPDEVRRRIGLVGQHAALDEILSGRQNLELFGRLYQLDRRAAARRADELLEQLDLGGTGRKPVRQYSGGMRRRLDLAASLVLAPPVLFLDEPTAGLDPRGRNAVWQAVRGLVSGGTTVLLTTQYLEEADQLAHAIAVMNTGRVIATGTSVELKSRLGGDRIEVVTRSVDDLATVAAVVAAIGPPGSDTEVDVDTRRVSGPVRDPIEALTEVVRELDAQHVVVEDIGLRRPTLDEVFLHLTGRPATAPTEPEVAA